MNIIIIRLKLELNIRIFVIGFKGKFPHSKLLNQYAKNSRIINGKGSCSIVHTTWRFVELWS